MLRLLYLIAVWLIDAMGLVDLQQLYHILGEELDAEEAGESATVD
jgi:hypothetical protein